MACHYFIKMCTLDGEYCRREKLLDYNKPVREKETRGGSYIISRSRFIDSQREERTNTRVGFNKMSMIYGNFISLRMSNSKTLQKTK